jgi:hypothetical protein
MIIKVGPDGQGSYRYSVNGAISIERYHNSASARQAANDAVAIYIYRGAV